MSKSTVKPTSETITFDLKIMDGRNVIKAYTLQITLPITANVPERDAALVQRALDYLKEEAPRLKIQARNASAEDKVKQAKLADIEATLRRMTLPEGHITRTIKKLKGLPLDSPEWRTFTTLNPAYNVAGGPAEGHARAGSTGVKGETP